jgi:hypothetical protein
MYTVEIYKKDARTKSGERMVHKSDHNTSDLGMLEHSVKHTWRASQGYRYEIHETFVTRRSLMTGAEFQERYDTPHYCSPSSETYWSM